MLSFHPLKWFGFMWPRAKKDLEFPIAGRETEREKRACLWKLRKHLEDLESHPSIIFFSVPSENINYISLSSFLSIPRRVSREQLRRRLLTFAITVCHQGQWYVNYCSFTLEKRKKRYSKHFGWIRQLWHVVVRFFSRKLMNFPRFFFHRLTSFR